jgi:hypothetical protein
VISTETGIVRTAHSGVAEEGGTSGENALISRLHMCVGTDDRRNLPIEKSAHGDLLTGRFGVHIDDDDSGLLAQAIDLCHGRMERIVQDGLHKGAALHIENPDFSLCSLQNDAPLAWRARGIIDRPKESRLRGYVGCGIPLIPNMVARRDYGHAAVKKINGNFPSDPTAPAAFSPFTTTKSMARSLR